ncbi:hypothetical protein CLF_103134 [Clonorchis sinensis]|uniref:Uncharacterized protein n=1 Tax=Clonorchis sinensis TaxID=79923 RepID=G7YND0_CLOSI|nr:hypothetical protein CLF_103134 [Clonorchis sinensis]
MVVGHIAELCPDGSFASIVQPMDRNMDLNRFHLGGMYIRFGNTSLMACSLPHGSEFKEQCYIIFRMCLSVERKPFNDKNKSDPGPDPGYQPVNPYVCAFPLNGSRLTTRTNPTRAPIPGINPLILESVMRPALINDDSVRLVSGLRAISALHMAPTSSGISELFFQPRRPVYLAVLNVRTLKQARKQTALALTVG